MERSGNRHGTALSGNRVIGGLEDYVGTVVVVRFELNTKAIDEKDWVDRVGDRDDDFFYGDGEKGVTQPGHWVELSKDLFALFKLCRLKLEQT